MENKRRGKKIDGVKTEMKYPVRKEGERMSELYRLTTKKDTSKPERLGTSYP